MAAVLVIARLCEPSSERHIAEDWFRRTALDDLLGLPEAKVNDDRLDRGLDRLLPHTDALETHLKERLGTLFQREYDLQTNQPGRVSTQITRIAQSARWPWYEARLQRSETLSKWGVIITPQKVQMG